MRALLSQHSGLALLLVVTGTMPAWAYDFTGAESCQTCHPDAYTAWKSSPHARAREVLSAAQQKDARCLSCHSPNETEQHVANVSCESCHGGGQYYSPAFVMKDSELVRLAGLQDPSEKQCRVCHDSSSPSLKPFEFVSKLKLIDHWSADRAKRGAGKESKDHDGKEKEKAKPDAEGRKSPAKAFPRWAALVKKT